MRKCVIIREHLDGGTTDFKKEELALDRSDELLKIEFERLVKKYDEDDPASIDAVNFEASMYWLNFLQAGFDPDQVARLLPSEVKLT